MALYRLVPLRFPISGSKLQESCIFKISHFPPFKTMNHCGLFTPGVLPRITRGSELLFLPDHVDVRCSFVNSAVNGTIRSVERCGRSMVRVRLPRRLFSWRRLPIAHGSFIWNPQDFGNLDGFYHNPMIGKLALEL